MSADKRSLVPPPGCVVSPPCDLRDERAVLSAAEKFACPLRGPRCALHLDLLTTHVPVALPQIPKGRIGRIASRMTVHAGNATITNCPIQQIFTAGAWLNWQSTCIF